MDTESAIRGLQRNLGDMAAEAAVILSQLEQVQRSIRAHELQLAGPHNLLSPISSLPHMVLERIFRIVSQDSWDQTLVVSQVYRRWRKLALSTPLLWSRVQVCRCYSTPGRLRILDLFMERSEPCSLEVVIELHFWRDRRNRYYDGVSLGDQLKRVYDNIERWRILRLREAHSTLDNDELGPMIIMYAPLLEILDVEGVFDVGIEPAESEYESDDSAKNSQDSLRLFRGVPKLVWVRLCGISCSLPLPSSQPLTLQIENAPLARGMRGLTKPLELEPRFTMRSNFPKLYRPVVHVHRDPDHGFPYLRDLTISDQYISAQHLAHLLRYFKSPLLDSLTIVASLTIDRDEPLSGLTNVLASSFSPTYTALRFLHLQWVEFTNESAKIITAMLPSITHISLDACLSVSLLFQRLLLNGDYHRCLRRMWGYRCHGRGSSVRGGAILWPRLQTIALSSFLSHDIHPLCEVIEDRLALGTPIMNVKIASVDRLDGFTWRSKLDWMSNMVCLQMQDKIQILPKELLYHFNRKFRNA